MMPCMSDILGDFLLLKHLANGLFPLKKTGTVLTWLQIAAQELYHDDYWVEQMCSIFRFDAPNMMGWKAKSL